MGSNINENVVLYDWLSFTTKKHSPREVIEALGLSHCPWTETKGARGYMDRLYFGCISVHYNGREDMGVWCEMSGQGCRNFEDFTTLPNRWAALFAFIHNENLHITRLDMAFDDHTGILNIDRIAEDIEARRYVSRMNWWEVVRSCKGVSCQIGSPQSKVLVRIYDKAAERGFDDGRHWVRVELQLRDSRAEEFSKLDLPIGEAFAGVLLNYLRFVEPDETDSNKGRWSMTDYWAELIGDVGRIKIFVAPGGEYNLDRCKHYVFDMAGNAIDAMLQICDSFEDFMTLVNNRHCKANPKYELLVKEHHARQEAYAAKLKDLFEFDMIDTPIWEG